MTNVPRGGRNRQYVLPLIALAALTLSACTTGDKQDIFDPQTAFTRELADLFRLIINIAIAVFVVVEAALLVTIVRFKAKPGGGLPKQFHGNTPLEIAWTIAPAVILAGIAVPTVSTIFKTYEVPTGADVVTVEVVGKQFFWEYRYPNVKNPSASELVLPAGKTVVLRITSEDVIHSYWVPKLAAKRDAIPGHTNTLTFRPEKEGTYFGQCAEFCGAQHANMRLQVNVVNQAAYDQFIRTLGQPATLPTSGPAQRGLQVFTSTGACVGCHTIDGVQQAVGKLGPNLTHFGSRTTLAGAMFESNPTTLKNWLTDPQAMKPGNKMIIGKLPEDDVNALVAFLQGLK